MNGSIFPQSKRAGDCSVSEGGLTKREYAAIEMTKAVITGFSSTPNSSLDLNQCIDIGIAAADRLFERLEDSVLL